MGSTVAIVENRFIRFPPPASAIAKVMQRFYRFFTGCLFRGNLLSAGFSTQIKKPVVRFLWKNPALVNTSVSLRLALSAVFVAALSVSPELLKSPSDIHSDRGSIVATETNGRPRWTANWTMDPTVAGQRRAVKFTETGRGRYSPFSSEVQWVVDSLWKADGYYKPLRVVRTFRDTAGKVLLNETKVFDEAASVVRVERFANGAPESKNVSVPPDTIAVDGIAAVLRSLPFNSGRFLTHLFSNEPRLYEVSIETHGRERVRTPAGEFDCYRGDVVAHA